MKKNILLSFLFSSGAFAEVLPAMVCTHKTGPLPCSRRPAITTISIEKNHSFGSDYNDVTVNFDYPVQCYADGVKATVPMIVGARGATHLSLLLRHEDLYAFLGQNLVAPDTDHAWIKWEAATFTRVMDDNFLRIDKIDHLQKTAELTRLIQSRSTLQNDQIVLGKLTEQKFQCNLL